MAVVPRRSLFSLICLKSGRDCSSPRVAGSCWQWLLPLPCAPPLPPPPHPPGPATAAPPPARHQEHRPSVMYRHRNHQETVRASSASSASSRSWNSCGSTCGRSRHTNLLKCEDGDRMARLNAVRALRRASTSSSRSYNCCTCTCKESHVCCTRRCR